MCIRDSTQSASGILNASLRPSLFGVRTSAMPPANPDGVSTRIVEEVDDNCVPHTSSTKVQVTELEFPKPDTVVDGLVGLENTTPGSELDQVPDVPAGNSA